MSSTLGGWRDTSLGEVTEDKVPNFGPRGTSEFVYVDIGSIDNETKRIVAPNTLSAATAPSRAKQNLKTGDVLVSMTRPNLNAVAIVPPELDGAVGSTGFHVLRQRCAEPAWLFYAVQSNAFIDAMCCLVQGALYPAVRPKDIRNHRLLIPPLDEQRRIVAEIEKQFTRLEAGATALRQVQAKLKRYRAAVLKAACEGSLVPTEAELARQEGRPYEPASKLLARILTERRKNWPGRGKYKDAAKAHATDLPTLPEGWLWVSVEQLSTKVVDGVHKKPNYVESGVPFVTVRNLTAGPGISFAKLNYVTVNDHAEFIKRANPEQGDILVSKDGTLGVIRVIKTEIIFSIFVSVALVKPVLRATSAFLGIALSSPQVQIQMVPKGSGLQHIHLEDLREDCIPLPPLAEQTRIVAEVERRLSVVEELEVSVAANLQRGARLRQSILQQAFSGRLLSETPS